MQDLADIWDVALELDDVQTTENVVPLMRETCDDLERRTNKKVCARFDELHMVSAIEARYPGFNTMAEMVASLNATIELEGHSRKDASELYEPKTYCYDIYNDDYKFRLFEMELGAIYPIIIRIDEGIVSEKTSELEVWAMHGEKGRYSLSSDDDLLRCFRVIVTSRKVGYILDQLRR